MVIKIPQHCNLPHAVTKKILDETGCAAPDWEISVQKADDVAWSVVLSYLIATNYRDKEDDFSRRLKTLTGSDKNLNLIKKSIRSFNPFRNRYACFYNESLKQVVKQFKTNLRWNNLTSVSEKLSAASALLRCPIVDIWEQEKILKSRIHAKYNERSLKDTERCVIALRCRDFSKEERGTPGTVYNFLINHQLGLKLKNAALLYFLKEAEIPKKLMRRVESAVKNGKHFLISILTSDCKEVIPKLYKSAYVISKLAEAGFQTDPRTKDAEGLSALYHALVLGDDKILYELYYFAANNCFQSEGSYRNPDSRIVTNLLQMDETFLPELTESKVLKHHPNYNDLKRTSDDVFRLNKFLIEVNSKIVKLKNKLNYYESTDETVFEACKRRDIIVSLLDTYEEFFKPVRQDNIVVSSLDDYVMFKNYYNLIDMATAIMFFDNIIFLKERLALEDKNQFSEIESSFFFSVLYHVVFDKVNISKSTKDLHPFIKRHINSLYVFPLKRRLDSMNKIKEFSKYLHNTIINKENVVKLIPRREIFGILNSYPVFKDNIHLDRLKSYIKRALNVRVADIKSVLVIERVLQVIGEYITPEKNGDSSFRRFLSLMLPKAVAHILRRTRHELSHLKSHAFKSKTECETNFSLFRSIQRDIRTIEYYFKPVFRTQILSGVIHLIKLLEEELELVRRFPHLYASSALYPFYLRKEVTDVLRNLRHTVYGKCSYFFQRMFTTALCSAENDIATEISWSKDWEDVKNDVLSALWPLKWLIELQQQCGETRDDSVLDVFESLADCEQNADPMKDLKEKIDKFITKCRDLLSTLVTPRKEKKHKPLKYVNYTEHFLKILKGFVYLGNEEREEIRKEIPESIKQSVAMKEILIKSIEDGFSLNLDEEPSKCEISYLSNKKMKMFLELYKNKNSQALAILKTPDPIAELEDIFLTNSVEKKKYDALCRKMQFSDGTKKVLGRLVAGQRKKIPGNSLSNLLNRVQLMKKILIEENGEIFNLWVKVKSQSSRQYIADKIVWYYLRDQQLQASIEMLLFDCMNIFQVERGAENPWIKSSKLYCGINLRNVLSHGSPLLESLCKLLDPEDLPSDMIQKILRLIDGEDAILAILELYERINNDYPKLQAIINSEEKDEYSELKSRILKCDEWRNYSILLPYNRIPFDDKA